MTERAQVHSEARRELEIDYLASIIIGDAGGELSGKFGRAKPAQRPRPEFQLSFEGTVHNRILPPALQVPFECERKCIGAAMGLPASDDSSSRMATPSDAPSQIR